MGDIQAISQGNYVLQGTVATSAGIVGDGTTQNPLRTDETVLYDCSNNYTYGTDSVTLSESYKNFELIKVLSSKGDVLFFYPANNQVNNSIGLYHFYGSYVWSIPWDFTSDTIFKGTTGKLWQIGKSEVTDVTKDAPYNRWIQPIKIIGINRKAQ